MRKSSIHARYQEAAVLLESLGCNYVLADGTMRIGWLATVVLCGLNGVTLEASDDDAYDLVIAVASGTTINPWVRISEHPS